MNPLRLGWYGDDFTGATDTLAVLTQAGLRAMLFLGVPSAAEQARAAVALGGPLEAVGIAGATRCMAPADMAAVLRPAGAFFESLAVPLLHYKVCSTFDSAPDVGSIGAAVASLRPHVRQPLVSILAGQPGLGRYGVFSHLFAAAGAGGAVERLDRHPTMSRHPVTPMGESDLRLHLARQGLSPIAALHYPAYSLPPQARRQRVREAMEQGASALLMDLADAAHLAPAGRLLWEQARQGTLLAVGSSSVAQALIAHWREAGELAAEPAPPPPWPAARQGTLVFAGSLSPVTARQVRAATRFERMGFAPAQLSDPQGEAARRIEAALDAGRHVLAFTAPADAAQADSGQAAAVAASSASFLRELVSRRAARGRPMERLGIAGGDTSSLALQAFGPWGLSCLRTLGPGVAISRAHGGAPGVDGLALMLKGGQMGTETVFDEFVGAAG